MRDFHQDKDRYFRMQYATAKEHIIPFVEAAVGPIEGKRVLEIGCAEAGVLKAFLENGCSCVGVELSPSRVELARQYHKAALEDGKVSFLNENIYNIDVDRDCGGAFDLIILKDVIEHIPEQEKIIVRLKDFLRPGGVIFFGFPPWQMPFGGHQQIAESRIMSHLPYFHLLPKRIYLSALSMFGESEATMRELGEIRDTGISIERFERIIKQAGLRVLSEISFLINPIYRYKFNLQPRKQFKMIRAIPVLRNYLTTAVYYLVSK